MTHEELMQKAKSAKSADDILAIAKENGLEVSREDAEMYIKANSASGELSDDALDGVTGGAAYTLCGGYLIVTNFHECDRWKCGKCGGDDIKYIPADSGSGWDGVHKCDVYSKVYKKSCTTCEYMKYRFPFRICTHPETKK